MDNDETILEIKSPKFSTILSYIFGNRIKSYLRKVNRKTAKKN